MSQNDPRMCHAVHTPFACMPHVDGLLPSPALGTRACALKLRPAVGKALADHQLGLESTLVILCIGSCLWYTNPISAQDHLET